LKVTRSTAAATRRGREDGSLSLNGRLGPDRDLCSFLPLGTVGPGPQYAAGRAKEPGPVSPAASALFWSAVIMHHRTRGHGPAVIMHGRHMRRRGGRGGAGKRRSGHAERYKDRKDGSGGPAVAACRASLDAHGVLQGDSPGRGSPRAQARAASFAGPWGNDCPHRDSCGITLKGIVLSCYYRVSLPWGFSC